MPRQFLRSDYEKAVADYKKNWQLIDELLLQLCCDHPDHATQASVNAKVMIIGRTYGTGIERKTTGTGGPGGAIARAADFLCDHGQEIDQLIRLLQLIKDEPLRLWKLASIMEIHGSFVNMLANLAIGGQSLRAFASKYLYFHAPIVPIYDEVSDRVLQGLSPFNRICERFEQPPGTDYYYHRHVSRFYDLYSRIEKLGLDVSIKYVDAYLLWLAGQ